MNDKKQKISWYIKRISFGLIAPITLREEESKGISIKKQIKITQIYKNNL